MDHRVYFGGQVQSLRFQSGLKDASVGVINPGEYCFSTESAERVQILTGSVQFRMFDQKWRKGCGRRLVRSPPRNHVRNRMLRASVLYLLFRKR